MMTPARPFVRSSLDASSLRLIPASSTARQFLIPIPALFRRSPLQQSVDHLRTQQPAASKSLPSHDSRWTPGREIDSTMSQPASISQFLARSVQCGQWSAKPSPDPRSRLLPVEFFVDGRGAANHRGQGSSQTFIFSRAFPFVELQVEARRSSAGSLGAAGARHGRHRTRNSTFLLEPKEAS